MVPSENVGNNMVMTLIEVAGIVTARMFHYSM